MDIDTISNKIDVFLEEADQNKKPILIIIGIIIAVIAISYLAVNLASHVPGNTTMPPYQNEVNHTLSWGITFSSNYTRLSYNVSAIAQDEGGPDAYGASYGLYGLTDQKYSYSVLLSYNAVGYNAITGNYTGRPAEGFRISYKVTNLNGNVLYGRVAPADAKNKTIPVYINLSTPINPGDKILLQMYFSNGEVVMGAKDWNTGVSSEATYPALGNYFMGGPYGTQNQVRLNGSFTGLRTTAPIIAYSLNRLKTVYYSAYNMSVPSATMWILDYHPAPPTFDQFNYNTTSILEYNATAALYHNYYLSSASYSNSTVFITSASR